MGIKDNFLKRQMEIEHDPNGPLAEEVRLKALKAISQGVASEEWINFMRLFANDDTELARLTREGGTLESTIARARLVANAAVGLEKTTDTRFIEELEKYWIV